jgi:hypothetical protein
VPIYSEPYSNGILFIADKKVAVVKEINAIHVSGQAENFSLLKDVFITYSLYAKMFGMKRAQEY